jgi:hypothetical protein
MPHTTYPLLVLVILTKRHMYNSVPQIVYAYASFGIWFISFIRYCKGLELLSPSHQASQVETPVERAIAISLTRWWWERSMSMKYKTKT